MIIRYDYIISYDYDSAVDGGVPTQPAAARRTARRPCGIAQTLHHIK